jgi:hypothetical protein
MILKIRNTKQIKGENKMAKATFTWFGSKGNKIELSAEYTAVVKKEILSDDGYEWETNDLVTSVKANLIILVDGKEIDSCQDKNFWTVIDTNIDGVKRIWGCNKIGFNAEVAAQVEEFFENVIAAGKSEEVIALETAEKEKVKAEMLADAQEIIRLANKQERIMTETEAREWREQYNNLHNEGRSGYVPTIITQEAYGWATNIVTQ